MKYEQLGGDKSKIEAHFDDLFKIFNELREYLAMIIFWLPSYTQQVFQKQVDSLHIKLNKEKEKAIPKSKFSFNKSKKKGKTEKPKEDAKLPQAEEEADEFALIDESKDLIVRQQKGIKRIVLESEYEGKDKVYLLNIENCDIYLPFVMKALYIKNVYHSRIYVGFVEGASFFISTNNSSYHVWTHQTRIHKATNCSFFLHAKQGPIIEDSTNVKFGPYMFDYPNRSLHEESCGFKHTLNVYHKVSDFNWFKKEQSPNFSVMTQDDVDAMTKIVLEKSDFK